MEQQPQARWFHGLLIRQLNNISDLNHLFYILLAFLLQSQEGYYCPPLCDTTQEKKVMRGNIFPRSYQQIFSWELLIRLDYKLKQTNYQLDLPPFSPVSTCKPKHNEHSHCSFVTKETGHSQIINTYLWKVFVFFIKCHAMSIYYFKNKFLF